ncbi:unnamed protein product [Dovyalis caffra]|uniref:E3 ubiquitin-protein ligase CHIP n=1 Tax=Dovyalis caffra TaxID=77055 RepID=A0AAV1SHS7_9ROSI|nr:unnamed protein product [Dovyalis caffra]
MGPEVAALSATAKQAEKLKQEGNKCFNKDRFQAAIDAYTEAITLCPNVPVYWTNRALCHRKRNNWTKVEEDCRKAIQLDHTSVKSSRRKAGVFMFNMIHSVQFQGHLVKAHYMLGLALLQKQEYSDGVKELEKHKLLVDVCSAFSIWTYTWKKFLSYEIIDVKGVKIMVIVGKTQSIGDLLDKSWHLVICTCHILSLGICMSKKHDWQSLLSLALDLGRGANPMGYMVEEIWEELAKAKYLEWEHASTKRSWELQSLKEACESALEEKHFLDDSETEGSHLNQLELLGQVFRKAAEDDLPSEVPDHLCCKITLDIFRDPVITPSGLSYERQVLLDHLEKVGRFDPITREPLDPSQLVANLAIKEAVHAYLDKHGWAYKIESD